MKQIKEFNKLSPLLQKPLFRSSEARDAGVSSSLLNYYVKKNLIVRLDRGVYKGSDAVLAAKNIPDEIVI